MRHVLKPSDVKGRDLSSSSPLRRLQNALRAHGLTCLHIFINIRDMQLEHARRESELLRRISSVEGEMAKLAAQLESERCELENKQRDLEKARVASREVLLSPPLLQ